MPDFPIIDSHVHIWDTRKLNYPWLRDIQTLNRPFLLEDFKKASSSVKIESIVFMQCETEFAQAMDEEEWINELGYSEPLIKAIIPWAPIESGDSARAYLDKLKPNPLIKGVRRLIQSEPNMEFCLQSGFVKGLKILSEYDFTFDICISHLQLFNTIKMIQQCQETFFVLDHIAKPDIKNLVFEPWKSEIRRAAQLPNLVCKISGMVTEANHKNWTKEDLKPYIEHVIECFGFDRVMFGGDYPVVTLAAKYQQWIDALDSALKGCSKNELQKLYRENAKRIYKIQ